MNESTIDKYYYIFENKNDISDIFQNNKLSINILSPQLQCYVLLCNYEILKFIKNQNYYICIMLLKENSMALLIN